jgi:NAD-dependent dihydropyrimidine dehydrogenase PreA subunit
MAIVPDRAGGETLVNRALDSVFDTALRILPHSSPMGLYPIGAPDRSSPVVLTGNYTLTVRRVRRALEGQNVWLLVADSNGVNVWCASGGGHLTHHDVIAALRTSGIGTKVDHRRLILPQLCATGVERSLVEEATGWEAVWGPAEAANLPAFFGRGGHASRSERSVRFPLHNRLEMAIMWIVPLVPVLWLILWPITGAERAGVDAAAVVVIVVVLYAALPWLPLQRRRGLPVYAGLAVAGFGIGLSLLVLAGLWSTWAVVWLAVSCVVGTGIASVDVAGSTPLLASSVNPSDFEVELVADRCTGTAECVLVCPRDVLLMDGHAHKVQIVRPANCILCAACIVQCPTDALRFRFDDGRIVEPDTIRHTRLNLLGKRTTVPFL